MIMISEIELFIHKEIKLGIHNILVTVFCKKLCLQSAFSH